MLIGSPVGLQGELEIQFGRTAMDPRRSSSSRCSTGPTCRSPSAARGNQRTVTIEASQAADVTIRAGFVTPAPPADGDLPAGALQDWRAEWTWPDGSTATADSSSGTVRHGQVLRVTPIEIVTVDGEDTEFPHPDITFRFVAAGTGPTINARIGSESFENVTHLGGTGTAIAGVTLEAVAGGTPAGIFEWQIDGQPGQADRARRTRPRSPDSRACRPSSCARR